MVNLAPEALVVEMLESRRVHDIGSREPICEGAKCCFERSWLHSTDTRNRFLFRVRQYRSEGVGMDAHPRVYSRKPWCIREVTLREGGVRTVYFVSNGQMSMFIKTYMVVDEVECTLVDVFLDCHDFVFREREILQYALHSASP